MISRAIDPLGDAAVDAAALALAVPGLLAVAATPALAGGVTHKTAPAPDNTVLNCVDNVVCVDVIDDGVGLELLNDALKS